MIIKKFIMKIIYKLRGEDSTERLIKLGLKVGKNFKRKKGCIIDYSHCWLITIGDNVTLSPRVHILAHDASMKTHLNYMKIGLVSIGNNVFIGADSIILPNVKIGDNVIIGAGSIVTKDIQEGSVAAGNPAKVILKTEEYLKKNKLAMESCPVFDKKWTIGTITEGQKIEMAERLKDGIGYLESRN